MDLRNYTLDVVDQQHDGRDALVLLCTSCPTLDGQPARIASWAELDLWPTPNPPTLSDLMQTATRHNAGHPPPLIDTNPKAGHRNPYVGEGPDGARRSAEIDRTEADGLDPGDRRDQLVESAQRWDRQADELEARQIGLTAGAVTVHRA